MLRRQLMIRGTGCALVGALMLTTPIKSAFGCYGEIIDSVHFNSVQPDFGTPIRRTTRMAWDSDTMWDDERSSSKTTAVHPALSSIRDEWRSSRSTDGYPSVYEPLTDSEIKEERLGHHLLAARFAELRHNWPGAIAEYRAAMQFAPETMGDIVDSIETLQLLQAEPRAAEVVAAADAYLSACALERLGEWDKEQEILKQLETLPAAALLKDHIVYREGCVSWNYKKPDEAVTLFRRVASEFPTSKKREAALIMLARTNLLTPTPSPAQMQEATSAIDTLLHSYPSTRFRKSALGLQGRVLMLSGQPAQAFALYRQTDDVNSMRSAANAMLGAEAEIAKEIVLEKRLLAMDYAAAPKGIGDTDEIVTVREVKQLLGHIPPSALTVFRQHLSEDCDLISAYIYYRLYFSRVTLTDLSTLQAMALKAAESKAGQQLAGLAQTRLAEIAFQQRDFAGCLRMANLALKSGAACRDRALFMRASAEYRKGNAQAAINDLQAVVDLTRDPAMLTGARELLAIAAEKTNQLALAGEQYLRLNYRDDFAYILDVRMQTSDIEHLLQSQSEFWNSDDPYSLERWQGETRSEAHCTRRQLLTYTLGVDLIRDKQYERAKTVLALLPKSVLKEFDAGRVDFGGSDSPGALQTAVDLQRLSRAIETSHGDEARSLAMYRYASYFHNSGGLTLYNAPLWHGGRVFSFQLYWNDKIMSDEDKRAMRSYLNRHEVFLISRRLCLEVARKYPHTKIAASALYRAACASIRSGRMEDWLSNHDKAGGSIVPAAEPHELFMQLVARYPASELAKPAKKYGELYAPDAKTADWPHFMQDQKSSPRFRNMQFRDASALALESMERYLDTGEATAHHPS